MELIITNDENSFDPTPKLKSSPLPIYFTYFIPSIICDCGTCFFSQTILFAQQYCKNCLSWYINHITDNNTYLDVLIVTNNAQCDKHEVARDIDFRTQNIQEWCESCSDNLYFKQINSHDIYNYKYFSNEELKIIESDKECKLCGKLYNEISNDSIKYRLCSDCYKISSGWIESTLLKKLIPIIYLPWWDNCSGCHNCLGQYALGYISDCQKWCFRCHIIFTGCRYCLTTNVIFGITDQSQCRKCKRMSFIDIDTAFASSGSHNIDEFIYDTSIITGIHNQIADYTKSIAKDTNPLNVYEFYQKDLLPLQLIIKWIPFTQFTNLEKIAEGGFGIIYKAKCFYGILEYNGHFNKFNTTVAIKRFLNSKDISKYFLDEVIIQFSTSIQKCNFNFKLIISFKFS